MRAFAFLLVCAGAVGWATAAGPGMLVSATLKPGLWQLRPTSGANEPLQLCVRSVDDLIQLRHPGRVCSRYVVANQADSATIHYSCGSGGYGETAVTAETGELIRLRSQGLAGPAPFEIAYEGRRVGTCAAPRGRR